MSLTDIEKINPADVFYDLRDELRRHVQERSLAAFARGDAARDALSGAKAVGDYQRRLRESFLQCIGGLPAGQPAPLRARVTGQVDLPGIRVEKIIYESRPKHYVTCNLYLPLQVSTPGAAVLFLCGHHEIAKQNPEYQTVCQMLAQAGLIVLAQDPIGQGERLSYCDGPGGECSVGWGTGEHDYAGAQCLPLGHSLARYFLHDAMRSIDYLISRPEVDPSRIGVTGNSGGGTQTTLMMLGDPRIAAAAPATYIMSRQSYLLAGGVQDAEQIWPGFSALGYDHEDILLAMAPKPVRVLAVTHDFFPIDGTRRTVSRCKRIWESLGAAGHLDLVEDDSLHLYTHKLATAAADFFARHLLNKEINPADLKPQPIEPSKFWCTSRGQVRMEFDDAQRVQDANVQELKLAVTQQGSTVAAKSSAGIEWLRRRVMANRQPCELTLVRYAKPRLCGCFRIDFGLWWSQEQVHNHATLLRDASREGEKLPVTLALWDGGTTAVSRHHEWISRQTAAGRAVMVLDVTGSDLMPPHRTNGRDTHAFYGATHRFANDLLWLDDDLCSLRTHDVLRAIDAIGEWPGLDTRDVRAFAHGRHGIYAQLAAMLDSRITTIDVEAGPGSFADFVSQTHFEPSGIHEVLVYGILRHVDLPKK